MARQSLVCRRTIDIRRGLNSMKKLLLILLIGLGWASPLVGQKFDGLAQTPPMGWNSWNTFQGNINEQMIREMADKLAESGMQEAGYVYVVLDDCWSAMERDADSNLVAHPDKFPSGMKALGDYLHSKGFKFGIYNCAGTKTCAGFPGGNGHEEQDARMYASWGVDYLKYDWCNTDGLDPKVQYTKMRDSLHAAGRPIVLSMCEWGTSQPWTWAEDVSHLWRTTGDITDCWDCKPREEWLHNIKQLLDAQVGLETNAGPGHWNDPDMLEVGNPGLTLAESRAHFSLWCILAAPLMAGNDVRIMTPEVRAILTDREVIAIDQDPLGKQGFRAVAEEGREIWAKELADGAWVVCVLNTASEPAEMTVAWSELEFLDGTYKVRDLWDKKDLGTTEADFSGPVDAHGVALMRLTRVREDE
jgi:alpha-galactosidase